MGKLMDMCREGECCSASEAGRTGAVLGWRPLISIWGGVAAEARPRNGEYKSDRSVYHDAVQSNM